MVRRRRQKEQNAPDQDVLLSTSDTEVELIQLNKQHTKHSNKVTNIPISPFSAITSTSTGSTTKSAEYDRESICQSFTIVASDPESRNVCVEGDLLNLSSESCLNHWTTATSAEDSSSNKSESDSVKGDQRLVNRESEGDSRLKDTVTHKGPRFTHSERTDIINFIVNENEKIKQKRKMLNGWFRKAKRSFLGQVPNEQLGQSADEEEEDQLEIEHFNCNSDSRPHDELKLLVGSGDASCDDFSQTRGNFGSAATFLSNWFGGLFDFGRQSNQSFLMFDHEEGEKSDVFNKPNKLQSKRSNQTRTLIDCDYAQERLFLQRDDFDSESDDDNLLLVGLNKSTRSGRRGGAGADPFLKSNAFLSSNFDDDSNDFHVKIQPRDQHGESRLSLLAQVIIPFFIAGFGTVGAGLVLDNVQVRVQFRMYGSFYPFLN